VDLVIEVALQSFGLRQAQFRKIRTIFWSWTADHYRSPAKIISTPVVERAKWRPDTEGLSGLNQKSGGRHERFCCCNRSGVGDGRNERAG
jgi:hypothetical protein